MADVWMKRHIFANDLEKVYNKFKEMRNFRNYDIRRLVHMTSDIITIERIKEMTIPILKRYQISKAILFGSYAKGKATKNSDIDLYIDTNGRLRGLNFVELLEILVCTLGRNIDLIDKSHIEPDSLIIQEIENGGMVIYDRSEDYPKDN